MKKKETIKIKQKNEQGITLVALVITIVILIILATVTVNVAFGDGGLIKRGQLATEETVNSMEHEEQTFTNLETYINAVLGGGEVVPPEDIDPPVITSFTATEVTEDSITVETTASDNSNGTLKYEYRKGSESFVEGGTTYQFTGLTAGTEYTLEVKVTDGAGLSDTSTLIITPKKLATVVNELEAGDWVRYEDGTGVERDCVVLYDSTSEYGVEIITMETVEDVTLGDFNFTTSMNSYNSAISTLNNATSKYINTTYADKARSIGSDPRNPTLDNPGYFTRSDSWFSSYNGKFKNEDTHYETDWNQMYTLNIHDIDEYYWLASREVGSNSSDGIFYVRYVFPGGLLNSSSLCIVYSDGSAGLDSITIGLRPVIHLKSGIKVTGGTGEEGSPYILGT